MLLKKIELEIRKDWIILLMATLLNFLGLLILPLYKYGTIYTEENFGLSIIVSFFPISIPFSFLIIFLIYRFVIYFIKMPVISKMSFVNILILWIISFVLGIIGWYFGFIPLLVFTPMIYIYDLLINI